MIDDAAQRLFRLINDYLDFAKIDAGYLRLDLAEVDLIQVVEIERPVRLSESAGAAAAFGARSAPRPGDGSGGRGTAQAGAG